MLDLHVAAPLPPTAEATDVAVRYVEIAAGLLASLAWPVTIILLALLFRRQIVDLIARLRSFSGPAGLAASFALLEEARIATHTANSSARVVDAVPAEYLFLAQTQPRQAIISAFAKVEDAILEKAVESKYPVMIPIARTAAFLYVPNGSGIGPNLLYTTLKEIAEAVWKKPDEPVTPEHALQFWNGAQSFLALLKEAKLVSP